MHNVAKTDLLVAPSAMPEPRQRIKGKAHYVLAEDQAECLTRDRSTAYLWYRILTVKFLVLELQVT